MATEKRVFISYSHDSEPHKEWVRGVAEFLVENGVDVVFDQWSVDYGDDLPAFMEKGIRETDRVLVFCTDPYIQKANSGAGGVGYEKTVVTGEIMQKPENRRKFVPIVRDVHGEEKMPAFFGAAYYLDLSEGKDSPDLRKELLRVIYGVPPSKPALGSSPFVPVEAPPAVVPAAAPPPAPVPDPMIEFSDRFALAFPGVRGIKWIDDPDTIAERLGILLREPLVFPERRLVGWWRGPQNLHIGHFEHVEGPHFLMGPEELNIRRIAAVNPNIYYRKFVYAECDADAPTGLYPASRKDIARQVETFGYASEEYGLVDDNLPVTRAEYDDAAAVINGRPVAIAGRVTLRVRYLSPYNFLIAPFASPINNTEFDYELQDFLNRLLQDENVFDDLCEVIMRLPKRE